MTALTLGPSAGPAGGAAAPHPAAGRGHDHLQRGRGDRGHHRRHHRLVDRADRVRPGLGHRGRLRRRGRLAVLRPPTTSAGRSPRCGSSRCSFFALAAYVTVDAVRALLGAGEAEHSTAGLVLAAVSAGGHAGAVVGPAARRPRARLGQRGGRLQADPAVHLPVGRAAGRPGAQQPRSAGPGPTRSPPWSSPPSRSRKAARPGAATPAAPSPRP